MAAKGPRRPRITEFELDSFSKIRKAKRRSFLWEIKDFGAIKKRLADGKTYTSEEFGFRSSSKNKPFWIPDFIYLFRLRLSSKAGDLSQTYCSILSDNFDDHLGIRYRLFLNHPMLDGFNFKFSMPEKLPKKLPLKDLGFPLRTEDMPESFMLLFFYEIFKTRRGEFDETSMGLSFRAEMAKTFDANPSNLPYADFKIVCEGISFPCHKFILATRSNVFESMFTLPMKEAAENIVEMMDTEPNHVQSFLRFLYSDSVDHVQNFEGAAALLVMAEKYNIKKLKESCEDLMCCLVNFDNLAEAAQLAKLNNAPRLLELSEGLLRREKYFENQLEGSRATQNYKLDKLKKCLRQAEADGEEEESEISESEEEFESSSDAYYCLDDTEEEIQSSEVSD